MTRICPYHFGPPHCIYIGLSYASLSSMPFSPSPASPSFTGLFLEPVEAASLFPCCYTVLYARGPTIYPFGLFLYIGSVVGHTCRLPSHRALFSRSGRLSCLRTASFVPDPRLIWWAMYQSAFGPVFFLGRFCEFLPTTWLQLSRPWLSLDIKRLTGQVDCLEAWFVHGHFGFPVSIPTSSGLFAWPLSFYLTIIYSGLVMTSRISTIFI